MCRAPTITLLLALVVTALPVAAQIPDEFTNLKVLPKDISRPELVGIMRGFAGGLGVRCTYCHVGPDNLEGMDFATDEKKTKQTARRMMRMVEAINGEYLEGIETSAESRVEVGCKTCHHSVAIPQQIEDLIAGVIEADGLEAGKKKYLELRESYYGRASYDFGPQPLNAISERLFNAGEQDEAIALTEMNNELHPEYAWSRTLLGRFHRSRGDKEKAIAAFEAALALEPDDPWITEQLARLKQPEKVEAKEN